MIDFDNPLWSQLDSRRYDHKTCKDSTEWKFVVDEIQYLLARPEDQDRFNDFWPYICSEGTTWSAAYACAPYFIEIAKKLPAKEKLEYLIVIGLIKHCETASEIHDDLKEAYKDSTEEALNLTKDLINSELTNFNMRYLLASIAALKGHSTLATILYELDSFGTCDNCGEEMFDLDGHLEF